MTSTETVTTEAGTRGRPQHVGQHYFPVVDNSLQIGGQPITELAKRAGDQAFYAYDSAVMTKRVEELKAQLPSAIQLHYAIKANPMPAVVQHMSGLVEGLDVASGAELAVALATGTN
ncbi:MAG TPA: hypothetical protein VIC02_02630, partial [Kineobactrum sp.]